MITCNIKNDNIGEMTIFLDETELEMIDDFYKNKDHPNNEISINPKILPWLMEEEEFKTKVTALASFLNIEAKEFAEVFLRVVALGERKGGIICVQEYNKKEEFIDRIYQYFEEWCDPDYTGKIPPDFLTNVFVCLSHCKYGRDTIEVPDEILIYLLNIKGNMPNFDMPPEGWQSPENSQEIPDEFKPENSNQNENFRSH